MNFFRSLLLIVSIFLFNSCYSNQSKTESKELDIVFKGSVGNFTAYETQLITNIITNSEKEIHILLPNLPKGIMVTVEIVGWDIDVVGGVTGRAESNSPPLVLIQVSNKFPGGIVSAINSGLRPTIFHEFHHLSLGWAIKDNKFESEIPIAAVIEGLAKVFSEEYTGVVFEENQVPKNVDVDVWVKEILVLPKDADYQKWMFQHPDGRTSIGYKTGNYLIKKAMSKSDKTILELSSYSPSNIWGLAGY